MTTPDTMQHDRNGDENLAAWLTGDRTAPFEVAVEDAPCICESLMVRSWDDAALLARCLAMTLSNHMPFSCIKIALARLAGAQIAKGVYVSPQVLLDPLYPQLIQIEENALLGFGCRLFTHEYTATRFRLGRIKIGKGAVIGAFSTIRSGVTIGEKATVGMNSFVNRDVPESLTVGGVPARPLQHATEAS